MLSVFLIVHVAHKRLFFSSTGFKDFYASEFYNFKDPVDEGKGGRWGGYLRTNRITPGLGEPKHHGKKLSASDWYWFQTDGNLVMSLQQKKLSLADQNSQFRQSYCHLFNAIVELVVSIKNKFKLNF